MKSFLDAFMGKGKDDLIQVKDETAKPSLEEIVNEAELHRQIAQQQMAAQQAYSSWQTSGPIAPCVTPPNGLTPQQQTQWADMFGQMNPEQAFIRITEEELESKLAQAREDGYEEGYEDAETYHLEKDQYGWQTFDDLEQERNAILSGGIGIHKGVMVFDSKGVSAKDTIEGNEGTLTVRHIDKAVKQAQAAPAAWLPDPSGSGYEVQVDGRGIVNAVRDPEKVHGVLGGSGLRRDGWTDGLERELSPPAGNRQGHSEEGEGELVGEGVYEEAQDLQAEQAATGKGND
jgi:hypothetical protein